MRAAPVLALILIMGGPAGAADCADNHLDIRGPFGSARFAIEIADEPDERAQGLMGRAALGRFEGMLFLYPEPEPASFWMKNTLIPLDMIFADAAGRVTGIHAGAIPGDLTPIPSGTPVRAVLEVPGGTAAGLGIAPGDVLRHPAFATGPAAWPCGN